MARTTSTAKAAGWSAADTPLGLVDIATIGGFPVNTVRAWSTQGKLPTPDGTVSGRIPVWRRATVDAWIADRAQVTAPVAPAAKAKASARKAPARKAVPAATAQQRAAGQARAVATRKRRTS